MTFHLSILSSQIHPSFKISSLHKHSSLSLFLHSTFLIIFKSSFHIHFYFQILSFLPYTIFSSIFHPISVYDFSFNPFYIPFFPSYYIPPSTICPALPISWFLPYYIYIHISSFFLIYPSLNKSNSITTFHSLLTHFIILYVIH